MLTFLLDAWQTWVYGPGHLPRRYWSHPDAVCGLGEILHNWRELQGSGFTVDLIELNRKCWTIELYNSKTRSNLFIYCLPRSIVVCHFFITVSWILGLVVYCRVAETHHESTILSDAEYDEVVKGLRTMDQSKADNFSDALWTALKETIQSNEKFAPWTLWYKTGSNKPSHGTELKNGTLHFKLNVARMQMGRNSLAHVIVTPEDLKAALHLCSYKNEKQVMDDLADLKNVTEDSFVSFVGAFTGTEIYQPVPLKPTDVDGLARIGFAAQDPHFRGALRLQPYLQRELKKLFCK